MAVSTPSVPRRLAAPVTTALVVATGAVVLGVVDPEEPGHYPWCPFNVVTGLYCPGCGGLRAVHALAHGDLVTAVQRNALVVVLIPFGVAAWWGWTRRRALDGTATWHPSVLGSRILVISLVVFAVLRNLPPFAFLAP